MNNGLLYNDKFRYILRFKSRLMIYKGYFETYNYIQPSLTNINDLTFITFNTFTYKIYRKFNFKVYHWLSTNNITKNKFQYLIFGVSFENQ